MRVSLGAKPLLYPAPVLVVGTYDSEGEPNIMTASWGGICCSRPPCVTVSLRAATYSHGNIIARKCYTISIPSTAQIASADYAGIYSGRDVDKFSETGLTALDAEHVDAPYVAEFPIVLECRLYRTVELGLHTQFVGEVLDILADENVLDEAGRPDITRIQPALFSPGQREYFSVGPSLGKAFTIGRRETN